MSLAYRHAGERSDIVTTFLTVPLDPTTNAVLSIHHVKDGTPLWIQCHLVSNLPNDDGRLKDIEAEMLRLGDLFEAAQRAQKE